MDTTESSRKRQNSHKDPPPPEHQQKKSKMSVPAAHQRNHYPGHTRLQYIQEVLEMKNMIDAGLSTWTGPSNKKEMESSFLFTPYVQSFAIQYAKSNPEDVDLLSESQKQTIISSLAGYCVQEEWDVLMGLLPGMVRAMILEVFLETLIYKQIFERFFMAPFWYLDGKMSPSDEGDETFGTRLQHLYDRFYETNPLMAAFWRSETNRLANATAENLASSTLLATHHRNRRESRLDQFVDDTLSSEPIKWLLREPSSKEEEDERYELLQCVYKIAAQKGVEIGTVRGHLDYQTLAKLPETYTTGDGWRMLQHEYNPTNYDNILDGRRILIVVYPGIIRRYILARHDHLTEFSLPAYVVVQKGPEENEDQKGPEGNEDHLTGFSLPPYVVVQKGPEGNEDQKGPEENEDQKGPEGNEDKF